MKRSVLPILFLFSVSTTIALAQKTLPDVDLKTLDGKTVNIQDLLGEDQITVISAWATWCAPCKKELDAIAYLYRDWQEDYNVKIIAITIDTQRALAKVGPMVASKGWEYEILSDAQQKFMNAMNFQSIPQTFLVDQNGQVVYSHTGYVPGDEYELEEKIKALVR